MNSLGFEIRMKQYLLERLRAKHEALVQHYETCAPRNTTHGPTASEAWPMSEAAHNGSLVLLCGTEIKWGGVEEGLCTKTLSQEQNEEKCYFLHFFPSLYSWR